MSSAVLAESASRPSPSSSRAGAVVRLWNMPASGAQENQCGTETMVEPSSLGRSGKAERARGPVPRTVHRLCSQHVAVRRHMAQPNLEWLLSSPSQFRLHSPSLRCPSFLFRCTDEFWALFLLRESVVLWRSEAALPYLIPLPWWNNISTS